MRLSTTGLAERGELLVRRPCDSDERGVAHVQLPQLADAVAGGGAARAAAIARVLGTSCGRPRTGPAGPPLPFGPSTMYGLSIRTHRQPQAIGIDPFSRPGELLLLDQSLTNGSLRAASHCSRDTDQAIALRQRNQFGGGTVRRECGLGARSTCRRRSLATGGRLVVLRDVIFLPES